MPLATGTCLDPYAVDAPTGAPSTRREASQIVRSLGAGPSTRFEAM